MIVCWIYMDLPGITVLKASNKKKILNSIFNKKMKFKIKFNCKKSQSSQVNMPKLIYEIEIIVKKKKLKIL